jgi:hypothetical protein
MCTSGSHENIWRSEGTAPLILNLGNKWERPTSSPAALNKRQNENN